jgi:hypothetical protein
MASKIKITAPNKEFSKKGPYGVQFEDGVGYTDDERALAYYVRHGYQVEGQDAPAENVEVVSDVPRQEAVHGAGNQITDEKDQGLVLDDLSMDELKAYAAERDIDLKGHQASKDSIVTRIREVEDSRQAS